MKKDTLTDIELYYEYIDGNEEAFDILVNRYRKKLISYIMRFEKNVDTAEDLSQEVFLYMCKTKKRYDFKYKFETYLYRIAKSRTINYLNTKKNEISYDETFLIKSEKNYELDNMLIKKEEIDELYKKINNLKVDYKKAIYLKDLQGLSYKEICYLMNKNIHQVKSLIHRARKKLKKSYKK